jgi:hypothetical protein
MEKARKSRGSNYRGKGKTRGRKVLRRILKIKLMKIKKKMREIRW